ncbi:PspC domain-containing protein [Dysgonomonas sp. 520]|uniref:PspC domain-containing protein n=1 Tax=Dysgonomonas sp. 520 TaxID=2302931 RepID=UPI0013D02B3B|nr:PspC domain-containing protein [Dysgonomonas sp. 520]NDW08772.1 PspC domain-containing protein [Dysgonomonas sp. 520]
MKKVIDINIGGINFSMDDDAYFMLKTYLSKFEATISNPEDVKEVMEDIEYRIAEIFQKEIKGTFQVVNESMVKKIIDMLGEVNDTESQKQNTWDSRNSTFSPGGSTKRLYRDVDNKSIAGVCSGIAVYFDIDITLVRIIFLVGLICFSSTFWIYLILWIALPKALSISQKLEMRGIPVTAENIKKYSYKTKN